MPRIEKRKARATGPAGTIRLAAAVTAVSLLALVGQPAHADMAIVQQDATPIVSAPGVGGRVLARVDAGFTLTVVGHKGEWLKVASPRLKLPGELWVPAGRVGDIVADPDEAALSDGASSMATRPQFRITNMTDGMETASPGAAASIESRGSIGGSADVTLSTSSKAAGATVRATGTAARPAATQATPDTAVPAAGNPTPPGGSAVQPLGNPTPAATGNPTPASGNPTPALANPTPAMGNSTPALANPTPAMGNSTPAMGSTVVGFGNSRTTTQ